MTAHKGSEPNPGSHGPYNPHPLANRKPHPPENFPEKGSRDNAPPNRLTQRHLHVQRENGTAPGFGKEHVGPPVRRSESES
jgi:hypothetical protein